MAGGPGAFPEIPASFAEEKHGNLCHGGQHVLVPHGRKLSIKGLGVQGEGRVNFGLKNMDYEFPRFVITLLAAPLWFIVWFVRGLTQQETSVEGSRGGCTGGP